MIKYLSGSPLALEWHPDKNNSLTPDMISVSSSKKVWWLGFCGHEWSATVDKRTNRGDGCPTCSNRIILAGFNDLAFTFPDLAIEWSSRNTMRACEVAFGSNSKAIWECDLGHEWIAIIVNRTRRGDGCPTCSNRIILAGFNDLAFKFPDLAVEWSPSNNRRAEEVAPGSDYKATWECSVGHEWIAPVEKRTNRGDSCPICSNKQVLVGFNDLATTHPDLAAEWADGNLLDADKITFGSGRRVIWKCVLGHEWTASIGKRTGLGTGCPVCTNRQILLGFNDLTTTHPSLAAEWHPTKNNSLAPETITSGSNARIVWLCTKGHEWITTVNNRTGRGDGCKDCSLVGSSKLEVKFFKKFQLHFTEVQNGSRLPLAFSPKKKSMSVDILFRTAARKVVIEYDGDYWHRIYSDRSLIDTKKTNILLAAGYTVVRIRGDQLPHLELSNPNLFQISHSEAKDEIEVTVEAILTFLRS